MNRRHACHALLAATALWVGPRTVVAQSPATPARRLIVNAMGRLVPWVMPVEYPWVGGNFYQMEAFGRSVDDEALRVVANSLRDVARENDAGLLHVNDLLHHARNRDVPYTDVVVAVTPGDVGPTFAKDEVKAWRMTGELVVLPRLPTGANVTFAKMQQSVPVGGLRAYGAVFTIKVAKETPRCKVILMVPLGPLGSHMIVLNVAASRWEERFDELAAMLGKLQYESGVLRDAGGRR